MKKLISLLICFFLFTLYSICQVVEGKYMEGTDYIMFWSDTVDLQIKSKSGIVTQLHAFGTYTIFNDFLMIKTGDYPGDHSFHTKSRRENEYVQFSVTDIDGNPVKFVNLTFTDNYNKTIFHTTTDEYGVAIIDQDINSNWVFFSLIGYAPYSFDFSHHYDYQVRLMDYEIIENKIVVFKINEVTHKSLNLTLLSTNFRDNGNLKRKLRRLQKHADKFNYRGSHFVK